MFVHAFNLMNGLCLKPVRRVKCHMKKWLAHAGLPGMGLARLW
jgi:hypothetical protein